MLFFNVVGLLLRYAVITSAHIFHKDIKEEIPITSAYLITSMCVNLQFDRSRSYVTGWLHQHS